MMVIIIIINIVDILLLLDFVCLFFSLCILRRGSGNKGVTSSSSDQMGRYQNNKNDNTEQACVSSIHIVRFAYILLQAPKLLILLL